MLFECLKCSRCCTNLLVENNGFLKGLELMPEETSLFPVEHVFPSIAIGSYGNPKKALTFQLDLVQCPHLSGKSCLIYDRRPITCRIFPFELESTNPLKVLIDKKCKWYFEKVVSTGKNKKLMNKEEKIIAPKEMESCWEEFKIYQEIFKKDCWNFDLRRKAWFKKAQVT